MEAALVDVAAAPAEFRLELEHERSRLRAYYMSASQEVAASLASIIERNDPNDLGLIEEALVSTKEYSHELVKNAWAQLAAHRQRL